MTAFDRVIDVSDLDTISRALRAAENEIHNPGTARANNYDVLDLIDQARALIKRAIKGTEQITEA
jgi:hypothetical protein